MSVSALCLCGNECNPGDCWMRKFTPVPCVCLKNCPPGECPGKVCTGVDCFDDPCGETHHQVGVLCDRCQFSVDFSGMALEK